MKNSPGRPRRLAFALSLVVAFTPGCYSWRVVKLPPREIQDLTAERIVGITTVDGLHVRFDPLGGWVHGQLVTGTVGGLPREIALADVELYWVEREEIDTWRTLGVVVVAGGVVALILVGVVEITDAESASALF